MPDPIDPPAPPTTGPVVDPPAGTDPAPTDPPADPPADPSGADDTPAMSLEDALSEVTKTRAEAANYRVRARAAEQKLAEAKTLEEVEEIVASMKADRETVERALMVENVALKHNLPDALAARLQGSTREELEADAKALQEFAKKTPVSRDLSGGLDPTDKDAGPSSPRDLARQYGRGRR